MVAPCPPRLIGIKKCEPNASPYGPDIEPIHTAAVAGAPRGALFLVDALHPHLEAPTHTSTWIFHLSSPPLLPDPPWICVLRHHRAPLQGREGEGWIHHGSERGESGRGSYLLDLQGSSTTARIGKSSRGVTGPPGTSASRLVLREERRRGRAPPPPRAAFQVRERERKCPVRDKEEAAVGPRLQRERRASLEYQRRSGRRSE